MRSAAYVVMSLLMGASSSAMAQGVVPEYESRNGSSCRKPPGGGDVVILSMYGGRGAPLPYSLEGDQHGGHAVSVSGSGGGRIRLILSSYESTVWDLSSIRDRVDSVVAYGYYPQGVSGLRSSTPVRFSTLIGGGGNERDPCFIRWAHEGMYKIQQQADQVKAAFGVQPRRWYGGYDPSAFNVDGGATRQASAPPSTSVRASTPVRTNGLMPGNDGLEQLVRAGALRRFDKTDVDAWAGRGGRLNMTGGPYMQMRAMGGGGHDPLDYVGQANSGYLVLKSLSALPAGLAGADSVIFVVPEGLTVPNGAGHSTMYSLTGYPGRIPKPSGRVVPIDMRAQMISQSGGRQQAATMTVEWDASGQVVKDGTGAQARQEGGGMAMMPPRPVTLPALTQGVISEGGDATVQEPDASRDMTPTALVAALLFAMGGAGLVLNRRRTGRPAYPFGDRAAVAGQPERAHIGPDEMPSGVTSGSEADAEMRRLSDSLQEAIDLSRDDDTALILLRFKRTILRALREPEYDGDIAEELDTIVERHIAETVTVYIRAAKRTTGARTDVIEANLREGVKRLTARIDEMVEEQSRRDAERLRERSEFIRTRHPRDNDLGDPA